MSDLDYWNKSYIVTRGQLNGLVQDAFNSSVGDNIKDMPSFKEAIKIEYDPEERKKLLALLKAVRKRHWVSMNGQHWIEFESAIDDCEHIEVER